MTIHLAIALLPIKDHHMNPWGEPIGETTEIAPKGQS